MIDQQRLDRIRLSPRPLGQRLFAALLLGPNFNLPLRRTRITLIGTEHVPRSGGAIFVMNHTDRYNYWPFQYQLHKQGLGYTATWVKGKYYEHPLMARFMDATNNIPIPSRGYLLTKDFQAHAGRPPRDAEYAALKGHCDGELTEEAAVQAGGAAVAGLLARHAVQGGYARSLQRRFHAMMERVVEINLQALRDGLNLLIFPEGTRSRRLSRGHSGAAQLVLHSGAPVIAVGCNGSDHLYPGNSPFSRGGEVVYRVGAPLDRAAVLAALGRTAPLPPFTPFTPEAERHHATFQQLTDLLMARINDLLDPEYQSPGDAADATGGAERGAGRFV